MKPLLDAVGVRVLSAASAGDGRYAESRLGAPRARQHDGVQQVDDQRGHASMQQRWGIPYFEGSFYGIADMSTTLREIARLLVEQWRAGRPAADRTEALHRRRRSPRLGAHPRLP